MSRRTVLALVFASCLAVVGALVFVNTKGDSLTRGERAQARAAVVSLLEADAAVGRLPDDLAERRLAVTAKRSQLRAALRRIWVPGRVETSVEEWSHGLSSVSADPDYRAYFENRLSVTKWESGRRVGNGIEVTFTGHEDYRGEGWEGWSQSPPTAYRVELRPSAAHKGWLLSKVDEDVLVSP